MENNVIAVKINFYLAYLLFAMFPINYDHNEKEVDQVNITGSGISKFTEHLWICYALFSQGIRMSFFKTT